MKNAVASWSPILCRTCGAVVQCMRTGSEPRLWCGHCKKTLTAAETTAKGSIALQFETAAADPRRT